MVQTSYQDVMVARDLWEKLANMCLYHSTNAMKPKSASCLPKFTYIPGVLDIQYFSQYGGSGLPPWILTIRPSHHGIILLRARVRGIPSHGKMWLM